MFSYESYATLNDFKPIEKSEVLSLVKTYQSGGPESSDAALALIKSQGPWIIGVVKKELARNRLTPEMWIDDVLGEVYVICLKSLQSYRPDRSQLGTYLGMALRRKLPKAIQRLRTRRGHVSLHEVATVEIENCDGATYQEDFSRMLDSDERAWVESIMRNHLDNIQFCIVSLRMRGHKFATIGRRLRRLGEKISTTIVQEKYKAAMEVLTAAVQEERRSVD